MKDCSPFHGSENLAFFQKSHANRREDLASILRQDKISWCPADLCRSLHAAKRIDPILEVKSIC